jgi:hypothetical protein
MLDEGPTGTTISNYFDTIIGMQVPKEAQSSSRANVTAPMPSIESSVDCTLSRLSSRNEAVSCCAVSVESPSDRVTGIITPPRSFGETCSRVVTRFSTSFSRSSSDDKYLRIHKHAFIEVPALGGQTVTYSFPIMTLEYAGDCKYWHSNPSSSHREHFGRVPSHYQPSQKTFTAL